MDVALIEVVEWAEYTFINHIAVSILMCFQVCGKIGTFVGICKSEIVYGEVLKKKTKVVVEFCGREIK